MNELSNGLTIIVEDTNKTYHTLDDWDFALGNNNYISDPEMETNYIDVPYRDGLIDASTSMIGRPVYKKRQLSFEMGGTRRRLEWDTVISSIRNAIHGRTCQLIMDNDISYYWRGRVFVENFDRFRGLGTFQINVPNADPYKYSLLSSSEPWLWDPFNFETGVIIFTGAWTVNGTLSETVLAGHMPTCPKFIVSDLVGDAITLTVGNQNFTLVAGTNSFPEIMVGGDKDVAMTLTGYGKVQIVYKSGSL